MSFILNQFPVTPKGNNWASSWDFGIYHIGDQRRFRRACASAQSRQTLRCSHTWSMEVDEGSDQKWHLAPLDGCACVFEEFTEDEKCPIISWAGSYNFCSQLDIDARLWIISEGQNHTMYYIRPLFYDLSTFCYNLVKCIGYYTNCIGAATQSNQMGTNTHRNLNGNLDISVKKRW